MAARLTEQQKRELALKVAIARGKAREGIPYDFVLAKKLDVSTPTFARYRSEGFQKVKLHTFGLMCRTLKFTGREVCEILGVPYE